MLLEGKAMQTKQFRAFMAQIEQLSTHQRKQTLHHIKEQCDIDTVETVIGSVESCPHCNNTDLLIMTVIIEISVFG